MSLNLCVSMERLEFPLSVLAYCELQKLSHTIAVDSIKREALVGCKQEEKEKITNLLADHDKMLDALRANAVKLADLLAPAR